MGNRDMTLKEHLRWIAVYVLGGAALAVLAPILSGTVTTPVGVALGGLVVIGGALVHDIAVRNRRERHIGRLMDRLELDQVAIRAEMEDVQAEARILARDTIRTLEKASAAGAMEILRAETRAEIRTLRAVVDRVVAKIEGQRNQAPDRSDAPAAAARRPSRQLWRSRIIEAESLTDEALLDLVRDAVRHDRIDLALQPIVSLPQRKLRHYQAFAHLRTSDGAIITPEQYRRVADSDGTGRQIDNVLLFRVAQLIRETVRRQHTVGVFASLSPESLADPSFVDELLEFVAANPELAGSLVLTIADCPLDRVQRLIGPCCDRFHDAGLRLALENFGPLSDLDEDVLTRMGVRFLKVSAHRILAETEAATGQATAHDTTGHDTAEAGRDADPDATPDAGSGARHGARSHPATATVAERPEGVVGHGVGHGAGHGGVGGYDPAVDPFENIRAMLDRVAIDLVVHDIDDEQSVINLLDYPIDFGQGVMFGEPRLR